MAGNPSTENIDERLIRSLGLESEFEISYEEYIRHLKEVLVAARMTKSRYSTEEAMLAGAEFKRVRGKKGRFIIRVKRIKVTASNLGLGNFRKPLRAAQQRLMLAPGKGSTEDIFSKIDDLLASILGNVTEQNKEEKKKANLDRKEKENKKRKQKELGLEKTKQGLTKVITAVTKPFQSLLDKILNFFIMTFLGRAVIGLLDWFADPENKKKIDTIGRFLKDWWPAIVGGFVLFGTKFGKGVRILTRIAFSAIGKLAKAIPALLRFGKNNPKAALGIAGGAWAATQLAQRAFTSNEPEQKLWGGGLARKMFASGGRVSGAGGIDKVPAWLTNGEFVMSKGAVDAYGVGTLEAMNAAGGGTNVPTIGPAGLYAAGGGAIGQASNLIMNEEALSSLSAGTNDYVVPGGKSVMSGMDWSKIKPQTTLHAYPDSRGIPTIGWGSTFYDKLTQGIKPVKLGDTITKGKADQILSSHIGQISSLYSRKMKNWKNMSAGQQAAILSIGYNAGPSAPLGAYPKLSAALASGNMPLAAQNAIRSGPSAARIRNEQRLLLSGPKDTSRQSASTPISGSKDTSRQSASTPPPAQLNPLQRAGQAFASIFKPPTKKKPIIVNASAGGSGGSGGGNNVTAQKPLPDFNATHRKGTRVAEAVLGVKK
jgi:GH24 family phage-related lysozyme (muramidase)